LKQSSTIYTTATPRVPFAAAAVVLTVLTLGVLVVLPSTEKIAMATTPVLASEDAAAPVRCVDITAGKRPGLIATD
jgi:hypothetical protein